MNIKRCFHRYRCKRARLEPMEIAGTGWYLHENNMTAEEIARQAGIPVENITEHIGMKTKHVAGSDDHPFVIDS